MTTFVLENSKSNTSTYEKSYIACRILADALFLENQCAKRAHTAVRVFHQHKLRSLRPAKSGLGRAHQCQCRPRGRHQVPHELAGCQRSDVSAQHDRQQFPQRGLLCQFGASYRCRRHPIRQHSGQPEPKHGQPMAVHRITD